MKMNNVKYTLAISLACAFLSIGSGVFAAGNLVNVRIGDIFVFTATDGSGNSWEETAGITGSFLNLLTRHRYLIMEQSGYDHPGNYDTFIFRSTTNEVYEYEGFGLETLGLQDAPVGTVWYFTNSWGDNIKATIEDTETVTVPAGTFEGCIKVRKECTNCSNPNAYWTDWIAPGFFMVKETDYWNDNPPKTYELKQHLFYWTQ